MPTTHSISLIATAIKWVARIYTILIFIVAVIVVADPAPLLNRHLILIDWLTLLLFPGVPLIGLLLAWRWEALGGAVTLISWLFHFFVKKFTVGVWFSDFGELAAWFFAFAIPSLLFLISWTLSRSQSQIIRKDENKNKMKNYPDINSEFKTSADYAIRVAKEKLNIGLGYDESSLQALEDLLDKAFRNFSELSKQGRLEEKSIQQNTKIWGSYLGELIRHKLGGEWHMAGESYVLWVKGISFYPLSFVNQRITTNPNYSVIQYYADVSNRVSVFNESTDASTHLKNAIHRERKINPEENNKNAQSEKSSSNPYIALGLLAFCLLSLIVIAFLQRPTTNTTKQNYQAPPVATTDPQEQIALEAIQNQNTIFASNMHESIGVVLVILENDGHTISVDGWSVGKGGGHYVVKFYFYLDGERQFAEWWYYSDTGSKIAQNDWAFAFMGE